MLLECIKVLLTEFLDKNFDFGFVELAIIPFPVVLKKGLQDVRAALFC